MFEKGRVRPSSNPTYRSRPQTSQPAQAPASTPLSRTRFARARARARANLDGCTINLTSEACALGQGLGLPAQTLPSLANLFLLTRFLICPAVTKSGPPLRGGPLFARLARIVALKKLRQSYQIAAALNCARGAQQQQQSCCTIPSSKY